MSTPVEIVAPRRRRRILVVVAASLAAVLTGVLLVRPGDDGQAIDVAAQGGVETPVTVPGTVPGAEERPTPITEPPTTVTSAPATVPTTPPSSVPRPAVTPTSTTRPPVTTTTATPPGASTKATATGLYVVDADSGALRRVAVGRVYEPVWSPDGSRLLFVRDNQLVAVNADGTGEQVIGPATPLRPAWSPDGRQVAFINGGAAFVASLDGGGPRALAEGGACAVGWSPDGQQIAFAAAVSMKNTLEVVRPDGTERKVVATSIGCDGRVAWSPDSTRIGYLDFNVGPAVVDVATGTRTALTTQRNMGWPMSWAPGGEEIALADYVWTTNNLSIARADGSGVRTIATGAVAPAWAPDGRRIAFSGNRNPDRSGELLTHLYVVNATGSAERILVSDTRSTHVDAPAWAPDSTRIAFAFTA